MSALSMTEDGSQHSLSVAEPQTSPCRLSLSVPHEASSVNLNISNPFSPFYLLFDRTAGLAIAARLSENPLTQVGVLEAGISGFNVSIIDIPGDFGADLNTVSTCIEAGARKQVARYLELVRRRMGKRDALAAQAQFKLQAESKPLSGVSEMSKLHCLSLIWQWNRGGSGRREDSHLTTATDVRAV